MNNLYQSKTITVANKKVNKGGSLGGQKIHYSEHF